MSWKYLILLLCISFVCAENDSAASNVPSETKDVLDKKVQKRGTNDNTIAIPANGKITGDTNRAGMAVLSVYNEHDGVGETVNAYVPIKSSPLDPRNSEMDRDLRTLSGFPLNINYPDRDLRKVGGGLSNYNANIPPAVEWNAQNPWPAQTLRSNNNMGQLGPQFEVQNMGTYNNYGRTVPVIPDQYWERNDPSTVVDPEIFRPVSDVSRQPNQGFPNTIPTSQLFDTYDVSRRSMSLPIPKLKPGQAAFRRSYSPQGFFDYDESNREAPEVRDLNIYESHHEAFNGYFDKRAQPGSYGEIEQPDNSRRLVGINQPGYIPYRSPPGELTGMNRNYIDEATSNKIALNDLHGNIDRNDYRFDKPANPWNPGSGRFSDDFNRVPEMKSAWFPIARASEFLRSGASRDVTGLRRLDAAEAMAVKDFYLKTGEKVNTF